MINIILAISSSRTMTSISHLPTINQSEEQQATVEAKIVTSTIVEADTKKDHQSIKTITISNNKSSMTNKKVILRKMITMLREMTVEVEAEAKEAVEEAIVVETMEARVRLMPILPMTTTLTVKVSYRFHLSLIISFYSI